MPSHPLRPTRQQIALFALSLVAVLSGCGRKEPPQPPPSRVPAAPQEIRAEQRGEEILMSFPFPTTTIGGLALETFAAAEVYELVREVPEGFFDEPEPDEEDEDEDREGIDDAQRDRDADTKDDFWDGGSGGGDFWNEGSKDDDLWNAASRDGKETPRDDGASPEKSEDGEEDEDEKTRPTRKPKKKVFTVERSEFRAAAQVRLRLEGAELAASTEGDRIATRFRLQEISPDTLVAHIFGVKILVDDDKLISPYSTLTTLVPKTPPPPTTGLQVNATPNGIRLLWKSDTVALPEDEKEAADTEAGETDDEVEESAATATPTAEADPLADPLPNTPAERQIVGFNVYRRLAQEPGFGRPLRQVEPNARRFVDATAPYDARYVYAVTAIRETGPLIESAIAEEREIDYHDAFPPPVPKNVAALAERGRVRVLWTPRPTGDLAGYLVYRIPADGTERLLTPAPIVDSEYIDTEVTSGERLGYFVVSIDRAGNRSDPSDVSETTVP